MRYDNDWLWGSIERFGTELCKIRSWQCFNITKYHLHYVNFKDHSTIISYGNKLPISIVPTFHIKLIDKHKCSFFFNRLHICLKKVKISWCFIQSFSIYRLGRDCYRVSWTSKKTPILKALKLYIIESVSKCLRTVTTEALF